MRLWIINAAFSLLMGLAGAAAGWWVRGQYERTAANNERRLVRDAMEGLQESTAKIRTRVASHVNELQHVLETLEADESQGDEAISTAVEQISDSSNQVRRQLAEVEQKLNVEVEVIGQAISQDQPELLFMKRLDRKKQLYRKVLCSLEMLAKDLSVDVDEHRSRVESIGEVLDEAETQTSEHVFSAVDQIVAATSKMQEKISKVENRLEEQAALVEKHAKLAGNDELTGLPNRRTFESELSRLHEEYVQRNNSFSLMMVDVDHFKSVNDQHGHQAGDAVLVELGSLLAKQVREKDIAARYGGEEFVILLPFTTDFDAKLIAERIRKACSAKSFSIEGKQHRITVSVGVSAVMPDTTRESTVQRADLALYAAKNAGRDCTFFHDGKDCIAFGSTKAETKKKQAAKKKKPKAKSSEKPASRRKTAKQEQLPPVVVPPEFELSNRSIFCTSVNQRLAEFNRGGAEISLLLLQIDQSDKIRSQHGDRAAQELRAAVCRMLAAFTRDMDYRCEFDAKTYGILLPSANVANLRAIGERLREGVAGCQMQFSGKKWNLTASVGVVHADMGGSGMDLISRVEKAVQTASRHGGNATYIAEKSGVTRVTPSPQQPAKSPT